MDADGDFVITWTSYSQDGDGYGIYAQRYDKNGTTLGGEFLVNTRVSEYQESSAIAMDADGDFIITWQSNAQDGGGIGIYAQRYDKNGTTVGTEFLVNTYTANNQISPSVATDNLGNFVITWVSNQDGSGYGIYAQRYDNTGSTIGGEFLVNTITTGSQNNPSIAMDSDGGFVITWQGDAQDGDGSGVYAQRYDKTGTTIGGEFLVNDYTTDYQVNPQVSMDASGNFVVAWTSYNTSADYGIYAKKYDNNGQVVSNEFLVNSYTTGYQYSPSLAMDKEGDFVITWSSQNQDGNAYGVYAQRFANSVPTITGFSSTVTSGVTDINLPIGTVTGVENDAFQTISYAIISGNESNLFSINSVTGAIFASGTLPTSSTSYVLTVQGMDNGSPMKSGTATVNVTVEVPTSIAKGYVAQSSDVQLYPNPAKGSVSVNVLGYKEVMITNLSGGVVASFKTNDVAFDISSIPAGIYAVQIKSGESIYYKKLVIE